MDIDGSPSEEQKIIIDSFQSFCDRNIAPNYGAWLKSKVFPRSIMKGLSRLILSSTIPSENTEKMDELTLGLISESMGKNEFPVPAFLTMHFAKMLPFISGEEERKSFMDKYLSGDLVICGAFTEPGRGSDSASITTVAKRDGNYYIVNGEKAFVSSPVLADAHIITARTAPIEEGKLHRGLSLIILDAKSEGIEPYETENMASVFSGDFGGVRFSGVKVPGTNIIGKENYGFQGLMQILNIQRVHVALYSIGLAEKSIEEAIEYAKSRTAFGQPISRYQAVSFRLAEDWAKLESAKLLAYKALAMQDKGIDNSAECAAIKWYGCEIAFEAVSHALQTFGASGYTVSSAVERRFRATRGFLIGDGTPDIQKLIISRKLFGREFAP